MSTSVTCMITTSFRRVTVDLRKEPDEAHEVACRLGRVRFADGDWSQAAKLRSHLIVQRWFCVGHTQNVRANRPRGIAGRLKENSTRWVAGTTRGFSPNPPYWQFALPENLLFCKYLGGGWV